jgi:2-succinyl-6-hydroxy-2,4-cyclohexadiene-1-carboxylate synthase
MTDHSRPLHRVVEGAPEESERSRPGLEGAEPREEGPRGAPDPDAAHPDPDLPHPDPDLPHPDPGAAHPDPDAAHPDPDVRHRARSGSGAPTGRVARPGKGVPAAVHSPAGPSRDRVVLVHGFTQTLAAWGPVAERLRRWEVVRVDLPGHGRSAGVRVGFEEAAGLVGAAAGVGAYVGYSLGGRVCLRLALDRPDLVRALVLVGASPGIADAGERAARRAADERLAAEVERDGVAAFLDRWLAGPLFATLPAEAAGRAERLANTAEGLAYALRRLGTGAQEPLWDRLGGLRPPVLLVAGERDPKFTGLARRMAAAIGPSARVAIVPGAGHAVHLERPAATAALLAEFLAAGGEPLARDPAAGDDAPGRSGPAPGRHGPA